MIQEVIIVEGRDDITAVKQAVDAVVLATGGSHFGKNLFSSIQRAYDEKGIIIFTDPDYAGEMIRKRLAREFPLAKHAYLTQDKARKNQDIGIENASKEAIREALSKAHASLGDSRQTFSQADLMHYGLIGPGSKEKRIQCGSKLGIGYSNGKQFLNRLNHYGISREELEEALLEER